jgi:hypothetical protein
MVGRGSRTTLVIRKGQRMFIELRVQCLKSRRAVSPLSPGHFAAEPRCPILETARRLLRCKISWESCPSWPQQNPLVIQEPRPTPHKSFDKRPDVRNRY